MKRLRKVLALVLTMSLIMSSLGITSFAEADNTSTEVNPYTYTYTSYDYWSYSPHITSIDSTEVGVVLFNLHHTDATITDTIQAYCCDPHTGTSGGTTYKRINLEDSTYFDDTEAGYIRGIFNYGYWTTTTAADIEDFQKDANAWLEAQGKTDRIVDLTAAEAMTATQSAIWHYASDVATFDSTFDPYVSTKERTQYADTLINPTEADNNSDSDIALFYDYLIHQQYQAPEKILFSDEHFVDSYLILTENAFSYNVTLRFKLQGDIDEGDDLTLAATLGNETKTEKLTGADAIQPDADGYYTLTFNDVTAEEAKDGISMNVSGYQKVTGVYFYEAQPGTDENGDALSGRKTSQNFVGRYEGQTAVSASKNIDLSLGQGKVSLYKYDASETVADTVENAISVDDEKHAALEGAEFDLYALIDGQYYLMHSGLVTDANGQIQVDSLATGISYYFKETKAPAGFVLDDEWIAVGTLTDNETTVVKAGNAGATTKLSVVKDWAKDDDTIRPDSIKVQLLRDGDAYGDPVELNEDNNWSYVWDDLLARYSWSIAEVDVPEGYQSVIISDGNAYTITNTYTKLTDVSVNKTWAKDDDKVRPDSIEVQLLRDDQAYGEPVALSAENNWSYRWTELVADHKWSVEELNVPEGYDSVVTGEDNAYTLTNTYTDLTDVSVNKVWAKDDDKVRPDSIEVQLLRDGQAYGEPVTLNADNHWSYTWTELVADHEWTVEEVDVPDGYTCEVTANGNSFTLTNTYTNLKDLTVEKVWEGDADDIRPDAVQVQLLCDGEAFGEPISLNEGNHWTFTWTGLVADHEWTVKEINVPEGYEVTVTVDGDTFTLTNTYTNLKDVTIEKYWVNDKETVRPDSIQVQLMKDGKAYGDPITLSEDNNWTYTWTDLIAAYEWTVEELDVPSGYDADIAANEDETIFYLYNTYRRMVDDEHTIDEDKNKNGGDDNSAPDTGDDASMAFYLLMAIAAAGGVAAVRRKED